MTTILHQTHAQRLTVILDGLRRPAIKETWPDIAARSDKKGWHAGRLLAALAQREIAQRELRRIERYLDNANPLPGKTLDTFAFDAVPTVSRVWCGMSMLL